MPFPIFRIAVGSGRIPVPGSWPPFPAPVPVRRRCHFERFQQWFELPHGELLRVFHGKFRVYGLCRKEGPVFSERKPYGVRIGDFLAVGAVDLVFRRRLFGKQCSRAFLRLFPPTSLRR